MLKTSRVRERGSWRGCRSFDWVRFGVRQESLERGDLWFVCVGRGVIQVYVVFTVFGSLLSSPFSFLSFLFLK